MTQGKNRQAAETPGRERDLGRRAVLRNVWGNGPRPSLLAAIAAVATVMLVASTISASAAQSTPSESATLIAALPRFTCPAGSVKLTPSSAHHTAHGADVYHYAMKSGPGFDSYVPPAGFNPQAASNAVLSEMNFPARPARGSALTAWKKAWSRYKGTDQPEICESEGKHAPLAKLEGAESPATGNTGWSGYVDYRGGYTAVGAEWYQTEAYNSPASDNEATWVGIGGSALLQDGTDSPGNNDPSSFWEYIGGKSVAMLWGNYTTIGTTIEAQVYYSSGSSGTATFYVHDDGTMVLDERETDMSQDYDPSQAEFINERPSGASALSNTGTTDWWDANAIASGHSYPVNDSVTGVVMTHDGKFVAPPCTSPDMLQYPNDLSGDTFKSHFCRAS